MEVTQQNNSILKTTLNSCPPEGDEGVFLWNSMGGNVKEQDKVDKNVGSVTNDGEIQTDKRWVVVRHFLNKSSILGSSWVCHSIWVCLWKEWFASVMCFSDVFQCLRGRVDILTSEIQSSEAYKKLMMEENTHLNSKFLHLQSMWLSLNSKNHCNS